MTIDERLEKLTERHEALAQAMELNASLQRDHDQRMRQAIDALAGLQAENERRIDTLVTLHAATERHMVGMMDAITRLSNIVADHDIRLDGIEGRA
jgi:hypothetical protein